MHRASDRAGTWRTSPLAVHPVLPSPSGKKVGSPDWSVYAARYLAYVSPANTSPPSLPTTAHGSEPGRVADPSPYETRIRYSRPISGAFCQALDPCAGDARSDSDRRPLAQ